MKSASRFALVAALLLTAGAARAAAPQIFTYSGYLVAAGSSAPVTVPTKLTFRFYDNPDTFASRVLLGSESMSNVVPSADGYFSVVVGTNYVPISGPAFASTFAAPTWMSVEMEAEGEMKPYVQLTSVPSAMSALSVPWSGVTGFTGVTGVTAAGTGNPITVTGTGTASLAFRTCAADQVLAYDATNGWICRYVKSVMATVAGCGATCAGTAAASFTTITVNSIGITAPAAGTIEVTFTGSAECNVATGQMIQLYGQIVNASTAQALGYSDGGAMFRISAPALGLYDSSMSATRAFTVTAAGTYSYFYRANAWNGGGTPAPCTFFGGNMSAVYRP